MVNIGKMLNKKTLTVLVIAMTALVFCTVFSEEVFSAFAVGESPNDRWKTGDRSSEGVDPEDESLMFCYLDAYGTGEVAYVFGVDEQCTVADLLAYCHITPDDTIDTLSRGRDVLLTRDVHITLDRIEYSSETVTEIIPFDTEEIDVMYAAFSRKYKDVQGQDGEQIATYAVKTVNGKVTEKVLIDKNVTLEPVTETKYIDRRDLITLVNPLTGESGAPKEYEDVLRIRFSAYNYGEEGGAITATGERTRVGFVAVDPTVIPYHSLLYIVLDNGFVYGYASAEDCGGGIKGNRIDAFVPSYSDMHEFGVRDGYCYIVKYSKKNLLP